MRAAQTTSVAQATDFELAQFATPLLAPGGSAGEKLSLHVERGPDGRLRRLDAEVGAADAKSDGRVVVGAGDVLLDASALKAPIDSLWLDWDETGTGVIAHFDVAGSDDLQTWRVLASGATVMSLQQDGNKLARHQIALGAARVKYLRLQGVDNEQRPAGLRVRARTVAQSTLTQPALVWLEAQAEATIPAANGGPAMFTYRLPAPLAIDAIKLELAGVNSLARVRVASRANENGPWQTRAEFTAFHLRQGADETVNDEVTTFPGARAQVWRIEPATPLEQAPTLRVAFRPDRFVFLTQGSVPYRLVAGSARARRADYPVDVALAQLRTKLGADWQPPLAKLGARTVLQGEQALAPVAPPPDWKTWLLWGVLVGAAALIGGLALSLLRGPRTQD
ncbi:MAG TPA: DUF3999 family protein [Rudaea sp.]|nr:DUF3999 family protein [Rudaea sp.]